MTSPTGPSPCGYCRRIDCADRWEHSRYLRDNEERVWRDALRPSALTAGRVSRGGDS